MSVIQATTKTWSDIDFLFHIWYECLFENWYRIFYLCIFFNTHELSINQGKFSYKQVEK